MSSSTNQIDLNKVAHPFTSSYLKTVEDPNDLIINFSIEPIESLVIFKSNPKLLVRLKLNIEQDSFYEAHQLYKTIHFRCTTNNLIEDSIELIYNGILYFILKNQTHCIFDLSKVFIETLKNSSRSYLSDDLKRKIKIIHLGLKNTTEERNEFSVSILKWSGTLFNPKQKLNPQSQESVFTHYQKTFGHFDLNREFAINFWKERNFVQARYHFLHSLDARSFAHMIIDCNLSYGFPSEYDIFLVQAVLQYLCLRNIQSASEFFNIYVENHPSIDKKSNILTKQDDKPCDYFQSPIINFIYFLLLAVRSERVKVFQTLLELYKPSLQRDPSLYSYLDRVGEYFFKIKKPNNEPGGMFSNLMRMFTSGDSASTSAMQSSSNEPTYHSNNILDDDCDSYQDLDDNDLLD